MTIEDHIRRMMGDLLMTIARLSAENDALVEKLKTLPPPEKTPDTTGGDVH